MFTLGEYFFYNDPVKIIWRKGTPEDPYVDKIDNLMIIDNRTVLSEVPDEFHRVQIDGYTELIQDKWDSPRRPQINEFIVNYQNGVITFHESKNAEIIVAEYKGRGLIQYPAERIYVHNLDASPYVIDNLQHFIEFMIQAKIEIEQDLIEIYEIIRRANEDIDRALSDVEETIDWADSEVDRVIKRGNDAIDEFVEDSENAISNFVIDGENAIEDFIEDGEEIIIWAYEQGEYANEQGEFAKQQGNRVDNLITNAWLILDNCEAATEDAIEATNLALDAKEQAIYAKNTTIMVWKEPVENYGEIAAQYPYPEIGWTTMVLDSGRRYRFDGLVWKEIDNFTVGAIPTASEYVDGLMTSEDYIKLRDTSDELNDSFIDTLRIRTLVFVFPGELLHGNQSVVLQFPFDGTLTDVKAFVKYEGSTDTKLQVNKISEYNFNNFGHFLPILNEPLVISQYKKSGSSNDFIDTEVVAGDYFSINILEEAVGAKDLTIQVSVSL